MSPQIKKRLLRTAILSLIALVIGGGIGFYQIQSRKAMIGEIRSQPMPVAGVSIGGPFVLTNHNDAIVTEKTFAGQHKLIYFGFTYCPAICPTELQKMTRALNALGKDGEKVQPFFVTVDPERDTATVLKTYIAQFHPRLIGLTGTPEQIAATLKAYRIYAAKVQTPEMSDYTMDHSSFIYLMGPDDSLLAIYRTEDSAEMMTADIAGKIR